MSPLTKTKRVVLDTDLFLRWPPLSLRASPTDPLTVCACHWGLVGGIALVAVWRLLVGMGGMKRIGCRRAA